MRTKDIIELYRELNPLKFTGLEFKSKLALFDNISTLRPIAEKYEADEKLLREKLKPEDFDDFSEKANKHNEAVKNNSEEGRMTPAEISTANRIFITYESEINNALDKLRIVEYNVNIKTISVEDFEKFITLNEEALDILKCSILSKNLIQNPPDEK